MSARRRSRSSAGMSVRTMAAAATVDTIYDFKVKVRSPSPTCPPSDPCYCLVAPSPYPMRWQLVHTQKLSHVSPHLRIR